MWAPNYNLKISALDDSDACDPWATLQATLIYLLDSTSQPWHSKRFIIQSLLSIPSSPLACILCLDFPSLLPLILSVHICAMFLQSEPFCHVRRATFFLTTQSLYLQLSYMEYSDLPGEAFKFKVTSLKLSVTFPDRKKYLVFPKYCTYF